ncbi:bifunctional adenosylcobinamide kinase/adenosylcobinamide-phosphate guanylyltransferase [Bacillus solimangrovi]|uniref:Uncharacterized protein n=1 Tax=Bacillus solimangrovi TaxID=1305675 RepID=A0A1E5LHH1_9BACI|nr:bifunctional adenosylcobinamide kinase/adenosylcobinamide-phosphate guanylyltransferase [Bacillus solimangrovi]OEH93515.1 hypothetical protein BFG57_00540 [Bacillus solimangrovi]
MHFITGGVCQGKRRWVYEHYDLDSYSNWKWQSAFETDLKLPNESSVERIHVIEGIEVAFKQSLTLQVEECRDRWYHFFNAWCEWEREDHQLVIIGADISKGIVPIQKSERIWRDLTGWCYQDLVKRSDRFDVIWCGLNQTLKLKEEVR